MKPEAEVAVRDADAARELAAAVAAELGVSPAAIAYDSLVINYFSILLPIEVAGSRKLMVKVPKTDLRAPARRTILPLTSDDKRLGRAEFQSLTRLASSWGGDDLGVRWVEPVAYIDRFNAIVTRMVDAEDVTVAYRAATLRGVFGFRAATRELSGSLNRFAGALSAFHRRHSEPVTVEGAAIAAKIEAHVERLARIVGDQSPVVLRARKAAQTIGRRRWTSVHTLTLKGIDIRNVLRSRAGDTIWLLDPGKLKRAPREADLARFLLTWRILFWGTPFFAMGFVPPASVERSFLNAYWGSEEGNTSLLGAFLLKEVLKHWLTAREAVTLRPWSVRKKRLVAKLYVDPFFRRALIQITKKLI